MYSLFTRALFKLRLVNDTSFGDREYGEFVDGANLGEMDCRWSPTMGLRPTDFEETRPHGMQVGVQARR